MSSFKDNEPDSFTRAFLLSIGLLMFMAIVLLNEGKKINKNRDNSVVVSAGEVRK